DCSLAGRTAWFSTGASIVLSGEQANYRTSRRRQVEIREEGCRAGDYRKRTEDSGELGARSWELGVGQESGADGEF
ncbi:MAG TPA: hypothetical protein VLT17_08045, partial [Gemmatimonadales bacterium]|nr:hypothetical protein [Gemmatimonadales bacterium]